MAESVLPARAPASEPVAARRRALDVPVCLSIGWLGAGSFFEYLAGAGCSLSGCL